MYRLISFSILILLFVVFAFPLFYSNYSQDITNTDRKVLYELPYPGILPDNPLYFIKAARDRALEITTRDNLKKAELYLLLSDKRTFAAILLAKKGKHQLAISTLSKAEKYALRIPPTLVNAKKQGSKPSDDFIMKLKLSSDKHKEVIEDMIKDVPEGEMTSLQQVLELNKQARKELERI